MRVPKPNMTAREKILDGLRRWPDLGRATNNELADALGIRHPMTVSQAISTLYKEGVISITYGEGLVPKRHIKLNGR